MISWHNHPSDSAGFHNRNHVSPSFQPPAHPSPAMRKLQGSLTNSCEDLALHRPWGHDCVRIWYDRRFVGVNKLGNNVSCRSWRSTIVQSYTTSRHFLQAGLILSAFVSVCYKSISYTVLHPSASFQVRSNVSVSADWDAHWWMDSIES